MFGGVCILFFLGTIPYSLSTPEPLDTVNININLGEGTNKGYGSDYFGGYGGGYGHEGSYGYGGGYGHEGSYGPWAGAGAGAGVGAGVGAGFGAGIPLEQNSGRSWGGFPWTPYTQRGQQQAQNIQQEQTQSRQDYCRMTREHTMCKFSGPSETCRAKTLKREGELIAGRTDQQAIVDKHNELRRTVAKGLETQGKPGPQPAASDMLMMVWDDEIAAIAQRWADQCIYGHDPNAGRIISTDNAGKVGQNIAFISGSRPMSDSDLKAHFASVIQAWYDEVERFDRNKINPFVSDPPGTPDDNVTGHYTQVVWASSRMVGCGSVYYDDGAGRGPYQIFIVCNYNKAGNMEGPGGIMYSSGPACSACPAEYPTCSDALCTE